MRLGTASGNLKKNPQQTSENLIKMFNLANLERYCKNREGQTITVLSLGCGICKEIPVLRDYLNKYKIKMKYFGIDIAADRIEYAKKTYGDSDDVSLFCMDASDLTAIRKAIPELNNTCANLLLTRNAEITSTAACVAYYTMFLKVIPQLMSKNSLWISSFYTKFEAQGFVDKELPKSPFSKLFMSSELKTVKLIDSEKTKMPDQYVVAIYLLKKAKLFLKTDLSKGEKGEIAKLLMFKSKMSQSNGDSPFHSQLVFLLDRYLKTKDFPEGSKQETFIKKILNEAKSPVDLKELLQEYKTLELDKNVKQILQPIILQLLRILRDVVSKQALMQTQSRQLKQLKQLKRIADSETTRATKAENNVNIDHIQKGQSRKL